MTLILNNIGLEQSFSEAAFTRDVAEFLGVLETQVGQLFLDSHRHTSREGVRI